MKSVLFCIVLVFLIGLGLPVVQVVLTRKGPITETPLMRQRLRESKAEGRTDFKLDKCWIDLDQISYQLVKAAITVEDRIFLAHHGFDSRALRSALKKLLRSGSDVRGKSTITNLTARNAFLPPPIGPCRKALEFYYSFLIERIWGKRRIMEAYLNVIETGDGVFGCEAAALHRFGKHAADLTFRESISICVSLQNPRQFPPRADVIDTCEWMGRNWKAPADSGIWDLRGDDRICRNVITTASNIAERLTRIAKERKTVYRLGGIGAPTGDGGFVFDCSGLIKSNLWGWNGCRHHPHGGAVFGAYDIPDVNANEMIGMCRDVSSDFSEIQVGELVWLNEHVGLYVGDGLAVESTPLWKNGVQLTACNCDREGYPRRDWMKHGKFPFIYYKLPQ